MLKTALLKKLSLLSILSIFLLVTSCTTTEDENPVNTPKQTQDDKTNEGNYDLEIGITDMTKGQVFEEGNIVFEWIIKNVGETTITKGEKVYISLVIDNTVQYNLALTDTGNNAATEIELTEDLTPGSSITYKEGPSTLNVKATLDYLDTKGAELCFPLWGVGEASIGTHAGDSNMDNNRFCVIFGDPSLSTD